MFVNNERNSVQAVDTVAYIGNIGTPSSVDEISTMKVAAQVAKRTDLIIANNVTNLSDTVKARDEFVSENSQYLAIPTIVTTDIKTIDDLTTHSVAEGESLGDIAAKYGVKTDTIRWANNLLNELVPIGRELTIPPVDGVYYEVAEGDDLESIATAFSGNETRILAFNDLDSSDIKPGENIMIPDGKKIDVVTTVATTTTNSVSTAIQPVVNSYNPAYGAYNGYAFGNCTWHAANRRSQVGKPIPNNLGNAATWASLASQSGFAVGGAPQQFDVLYHKDIWSNGGYGHVAFVEAVNPDGSLLVSDMNFYDGKGGGFNRVSNRTVTPGEFGAYTFIH